MSRSKQITLVIIAIVLFVLVAVSVHWLKKPAKLTKNNFDPVVNAQWDYEFGPPVKDGEMTYADYRARQMKIGEKTGLSPEAVGDGMDTWHWWVGVDNPGFWQDVAALTSGAHNYTNLRLDLLRILQLTPRNERFKRLGLINDPDAVAADKPDQFGLTIDRMKDGSLSWNPDVFGYSSGVIGLQMFKNEKFDPKKWDVQKYIAGADPYMEPPYKVGMACIFCHVSFDPQHPPADPENPHWENITSSLGNNYLREGMAFGLAQKDDSMVYHYLATQEPGTSETSRFPYDFINNPTNINSILRLRDRLKVAHVENITPAQAELIRSIYKNVGLKEDTFTGALGGTAEHPTLKVPHILTDGADSMGVVVASVRVYVNEGMQHKSWYDSLPVNIFDIKKSAVDGFAPKEFDIIGKERRDPNSPWMQTEKRMPNMATFLMSYDSFPLKDAEGGEKYLSKDEVELTEGKRVFADNCASCHSSKSPSPMPTDPVAKRNAWRSLVASPDFLKDNYLSDDARYSALELGTNIQRASGTNAMAGWTWGQMSSQTYKDERAPIVEFTDIDPKTGARRPLYNPLTGRYDIHFKGHAAFYRTPPLVSIWATAPFLHNNSLGKFTGDPSVKGRIEAFDDAAEKLLWPEKRLGVKSVKVADRKTSLPAIFAGMKPSLKEDFNDMDLKILEFPPGTPVNLLMGIHPKYLPAVLGAYVKGVLAGQPREKFSSLIDRRREAGIEAAKTKLLELNTCPDFVEDRGHYYGANLTDKEKRALIAFMKWM
jgi:mono/diheme cytochrome c family protein